jgi:hypothetical protein
VHPAETVDRDRRPFFLRNDHIKHIYTYANHVPGTVDEIVDGAIDIFLYALNSPQNRGLTVRRAPGGTIRATRGPGRLTRLAVPLLAASTLLNVVLLIAWHPWR